MLQYILKLSISLAVLYIFYRAILRPLTFYQCNRFYLLCYSLLSFAIPFIDIAPWVASQPDDALINMIPRITYYNASAPVAKEGSGWISNLTAANGVLIGCAIGTIVMLVRLAIQYISLRRIRQKASLLTEDKGVQLYKTDAVVSPFSFGNAIYVNSTMHTEMELERIIQHEFVHVQQRHTIDLMIAELLCVLCWFNPFAWTIRYSIRQNLEFIADSKVLANGIDKKEYQYLLLKVTGVPLYSITGNFNFSNLKKRITMMNKIRSTRLQLGKFLFVLPLLALLLLAFRTRLYNEALPTDKHVQIAGLVVDVATLEPIANASVVCQEKNIAAITDSKGYYHLQLPYENAPLRFTLFVSKPGYGVCTTQENWGNFYFEPTFARYGKSIELFGLAKGSNALGSFAALTGNAKPNEVLDYQLVVHHLRIFKQRLKDITPLIDTVPAVPFQTVPDDDTVARVNLRLTTYNEKGYAISIADNNGECVVLVKDKKQVIVKAVTLTEWNRNKKENEARFGKLPAPPPPPPVPAAPAAAASVVATPAPVSDVLITAKDATHTIVAERSKANKNEIDRAIVTDNKGHKEVYNFDNPKEKASFFEKYGPAVAPEPVVAPTTTPAAPAAAPEPSLRLAKPATGSAAPLYILNGLTVGSDFNVKSIAPNHIASINIVKGNRATFKYGTAARDGAIEIRTKGHATKIDSNTVIKDGIKEPE